MRSSVIFLILLSTTPVFATYDWHFVELSTTADEYPEASVWDGTVAWVERQGETLDIFYWDGETTQNVTMNSEYEWSGEPSLYDGTIAYRHVDSRDGTDFEIYYWDGSQNLQITDNEAADVHPYLWDGQIAYQRDYQEEGEIYLWDGQEEQRITYNSYLDSAPEPVPGSARMGHHRGRLRGCRLLGRYWRDQDY